MLKTDYLKWDAKSIQELLRRKLLESGVLTDQLYPSSDTKILIDLFAWVFDVLTYMLNNSASDVLFTDTHLYENMNRLVKLLGYSPRGYLSSSTECTITATQNQKLSDFCVIPPFASVVLNKNDRYGNPVVYSFVSEYGFSTYNNKIISTNKFPVLYNGIFKKHNNVFLGTGGINEVFTLTGLNPNVKDLPVYIDHDNFHVYIETVESEHSVISEWKQIDNIVTDAGPTDLCYELRLDENKNYTIRFGDGVRGSRLPVGSKIHVIYLQTNGEDGIIDAGELNNNTIQLHIDGFANYTEMIDICFGGMNNFKNKYAQLFIAHGLFVSTCNDLNIKNNNPSTLPQSYETVDEIREFAPHIHKMRKPLSYIGRL